MENNEIEKIINKIFQKQGLPKMDMYYIRIDDFISAHFLFPVEFLDKFIKLAKKYSNEDLSVVDFSQPEFIDPSTIYIMGVRLEKNTYEIIEMKVEIFHFEYNMVSGESRIRILEDRFSKMYPGLYVPPIMPYGIELCGDYLFHDNDELIKKYLIEKGFRLDYLNEPLHGISYNFLTNRLKLYYLTDNQLIGIEKKNELLEFSTYQILKKTR